MNAFEYIAPTTKEQAVSLLGNQWGESEILAGGTDLLSLMKDYLTTPKRVVNIKAIKEFQGIKYTSSAGLRLGALVTLDELLGNATVKKEYPALAQAAEGVTSPQIRNTGTVGGELCQRSRCWYFRSGLGYFPKDESGKDLVVNGQNEYHAILGNSGPAYFVHPSSLAPALIALDAKIRIFGSSGWRDVSAEQFFATPKNDGDRETVLKPNEILGEIIVPPAKGIRNATYEVRQKESLDWPLAAAAVALKMNGKTIQSARVVLGHVAPVPWRAQDAEKALTGKAVSESLAAEAGSAAVNGAKPLSQNGYKVQLARVAAKRALLQAAQGGA
ncbi:MAG: xanthine dehydrogenase family protein subunit M [Acidobacteria bacterium]|nr:xanthine dehydrogenase family protein subunit M [Acidobacteriota bacterium]MCI0627425.1 xanthine dehydrogenase family protein subunit M [Acidobacteriota bacterium]MCI0718647.1 xanthine dehydrogenase family protein subunit M [Acidobacteriota bacterium]